MKKNSRKIGLLFLAIGVVAAVAAGGLYRFRLGYEVVHPRQGEITEAVYGLGKVKSNKRYEVILGVLSTVRKVFADEGTPVVKGDPLILFETGGAFRAPFDGTVTFVRAREGETAVPQVVILRLEDLRDRYIELSFEQQAALRIQKGQTARVAFESLRGKVFEGIVSALYPRGDEFIGIVTVRGLEPNVLPGMTADVAVEIGKIPATTLIPLKAVQGGMVSVRKKGGRWQKTKLEIGHVDGLYAEVLGNALGPEDEIRVRKD